MKNHSKKINIIVVLLMVSLFLSSMWVMAEERLIMATTTSTDNTGLLDVLLPPFEEKFAVRVDVIAVGTGKAIQLAENGDVDIILVHARAAEEAFVDEGYGINRRDVMYNDFVILGPASDPANISEVADAVSAFQRIAGNKSVFVSRGDDSGTNKKELSIWQASKVNLQGDWYNETGQGMGASLNIANEKEAYILTDRGTYLAYKDKLDLRILSEGDPILFNPYGIIPVNPAYHQHVNYQMAVALVAYITSQEGQKIINEFTMYGEKLFNPSAITAENLK